MEGLCAGPEDAGLRRWDAGGSGERSVARGSSNVVLRDVLTHLHTVHPGGTVVTRIAADDLRWWTWAGNRANATLAASLPTAVIPHRRLNDRWIRLRDDLTPDGWRAAVADAASGLCLPEVDGQAVRGLKFGEALPPRLAEATLAARGGDDTGAGRVLEEPVRFVSLPGEWLGLGSVKR